MSAWVAHDRPLPTMPGKTAGIVAQDADERGRTIFTVQCSTCHRTVTDLGILAVSQMLFRPDEGDLVRPPYRRCRDCVAAKRHPEVTS